MAGQIIVQRGSGGGGGGGGTPGGANTQVQYNDGGAFGGDTGLTFDETTDILTVVGGLDIDSDAGLLRLGAAQDVVLARDAADILAQRRGTNTQAWRLYHNATLYNEFWFTGSATAVISPVIGVNGLSVRAPTASFLSLQDGNGNTWTLNRTNPSFEPGADNNADVGATSFRLRDLHLGRWIQQGETTSNPTTSDLTADAEVAIYNKADTLVFAYNNGGTMTYLKIPLDGSTATWTHNTTAP